MGPFAFEIRSFGFAPYRTTQERVRVHVYSNRNTRTKPPSPERAKWQSQAHCHSRSSVKLKEEDTATRTNSLESRTAHAADSGIRSTTSRDTYSLRPPRCFHQCGGRDGSARVRPADTLHDRRASVVCRRGTRSLVSTVCRASYAYRVFPPWEHSHSSRSLAHHPPFLRPPLTSVRSLPARCPTEATFQSTAIPYQPATQTGACGL
jgi:hypothetical protein